MKKRQLIIISLLTIVASICRAQDTIGIHFDRTLSWPEVLIKAKKEHKYIMVDCYATWCGPCKLMEQTVYPQKEVGEAYNKDFICVKEQMDQTPHDDSLIKIRYLRAKTFEKDYHVDAYPTFLFFDPDGNPVDKATGAMDEKRFVQLAKDARNPDKQYYAILKNFQPGKLDTAAEKGLANSFANSDKELASKIAADYLSRIPKSQLTGLDNAGLMVRFQDNPVVLGYALAIIKSYPKEQFTQNGHAQFIEALAKQQQVRQLALNYIFELSPADIGQPDNLAFIENFRDDVHVQALAVQHIDNTPESTLFNLPMAMFMNVFTRTMKDRAFRFYYTNVARMDTIMKAKGLAEHMLADWISNTGVVSGKPPDFDSIAHTIAKQSGKACAQRIITEAKLDWYNYLVREKKQDSYWPQLAQLNLDRNNQYVSDKTAINPISINNDCWDAYLHCDDPAILKQCAALMARVASQEHNEGYFDTYGCILYKLGQTGRAIAEEKNALKSFDNAAHPVIAGQYRSKIEAMKRGEKIWIEPAYQK